MNCNVGGNRQGDRGERLWRIVRGYARSTGRRVGLDRSAAYEHALLEHATPWLADIPGVRLVGTSTVRPSFFFYNAHAEIDVFLKAVRRIAEGGINAG